MKLITIILLLFMQTPAFSQLLMNYTESGIKESDSLKAQQIDSPSLMLEFSANGNKIKDFDPLETNINYEILSGLGLIYLGTGIAVHIYQKNAWWKDQKTKFHFTNDWDYALWIDKFGHLYASALLAHLFSAGLEAGNIQSEPAALYGSAAALAFELYVEVEDGFGPNWGFSPGDAIADVLGASFTLAQYYYPALKNIQLKMSYFPTEEYLNGTHLGNAIDDYEGQKYWLSFRMEEILPDELSRYWPDFLNLALGMGVENLNGSGGGVQKFYLALDLDAEQLPLYGSGWQFIKNTLNYLHLPLPGIRISPDTAFLVFTF